MYVLGTSIVRVLACTAHNSSEEKANRDSELISTENDATDLLGSNFRLVQHDRGTYNTHTV
jgi:hypothetical protein